MPAFIEGANGEMIRVIQDDSADGMTMYSSTEGRVIIADEDTLAELGVDLSTIQGDLENVRDLVTNGNLTRIRSANFAFMPQFQFEQVDALNLKLGGFDDAEDLRVSYRENFYKGKADQVERIHHGYATGQQVSQEIMQHYLDGDGNVSADVTQIGSQFEAGGGLTESDVAEAENEDFGNQDTGTEQPQQP